LRPALFALAGRHIVARFALGAFQLNGDAHRRSPHAFG
jgi:hypothetical protein